MSDPNTPSPVSLRDYFAGCVLMGRVSLPTPYLQDTDSLGTELRALNAKICYLIADAMLRAREEKS